MKPVLFSLLATSILLSNSVCVADITLGPWNGAEPKSRISNEMEAVFSSEDYMEFNMAFGVAGAESLAESAVFRSNEIFGIDTQLPPIPVFASDDPNGLDLLVEKVDGSDSDTESEPETDGEEDDGLSIAAVPEPAIAVFLIGLGLATFACVRRRRHA